VVFLLGDWFEKAKKDYIPGKFGYKQIAKKYGIPLSTVKSRFQKQKHQPSISDKQQVKSFDEMVSEQKTRIQQQNQQRIISETITREAHRDIIADKMISAIQVAPVREIKPIHFNLNKSYKEIEVVLMLSDIQAGTYISREATGGLNEYNKDILEQQFKLLLQAIVSIITKQKLITPIKKLNIHALGDMVEGMGIFEGQAQHTDQDLYNQMFNLAELLVWFIQELLYLFDEIEFSGVGGNHGRVGKKGENPHFVNWDVYLYKYIAARLQGYEQVKFNIPLSWWYLDTIQGWNFLLLHGDDIKCFLPGSSVTMSNWTTKNIEDIEPGECVLTHNGEAKKVIETHKYPHSGKVIVIEAETLPDYTWKVTPNHEVPVVFASQLYCPHDRYFARAKRTCGFLTCGNELKKPEIQWVPAGHVSVGDYLVVPRPYTSETISVVKTDKYMQRKRSAHYHEMQIPEEIQVSNDLGLILGQYVSDGSTTANTLEIAFFEEEQQFWNDFGEAVKKVFNKESKLVSRNDMTVRAQRVQVYSGQISSLIAGLGGKGATTKTLHEDVLKWPVNALKWFLIGYLRGDGHTARNEYFRSHKVQAVTHCPNLGWQIFWIARKCGYNPSIKIKSRSGRKHAIVTFYGEDARDLGPLTQRNYISEDESVSQIKKSSLIDFGDYTLVRVDGTWQEMYEGSKYDLTIEGTHTYTVNGAGVHNSWNGLPYYGIDRADARWTKLLNSKNMHYTYLELGHFHAPTELPSVDGEKIINGCWPGGSIFALKSLVTSGRPMQKMFAVHPEKGKIWNYPIWLDFFEDLENE
jgi:hypothetical protein